MKERQLKQEGKSRNEGRKEGKKKVVKERRKEGSTEREEEGGGASGDPAPVDYRYRGNHSLRRRREAAFLSAAG